MSNAASASWHVALAALIEERLGVRLRLGGTLGSLEPFVGTRIAALGLDGPQAYVRRLRSEPPDGPEFSAVTSMCTNGQTSFFRDAEQLQSLVDHTMERGAVGRPVHVWSAGCSTGDEPYSVAMLMCDRAIDVRILATDVNLELLGLAREGRYSQWSLRNLPEGFSDRYFDRVGDRFAVRDRIRALVEFRRHNLVSDEVPTPRGLTEHWDVILCRNVFIYYARPTVQRVLAKLAAALAADGRLLVAASEPLHDLALGLTPVAMGSRFAYSLADGAHPSSSAPTASTAPAPHSPGTAENRSTEPTEPPPAPACPRGYELAVGLARKGELGAARQVLEEVLERDDEQVLAWLALGHLYLQEHLFDKALEAYCRAQLHAPVFAEGHYFEGVVHRKVGNQEAAELALRRALFLEPGFWPASFLLAGIYDRWGRPDLSLRELNHTLELLGGTGELPFRSHTAGLSALCLVPEQVARTCRQRLLKQTVR